MRLITIPDSNALRVTERSTQKIGKFSNHSESGFPSPFPLLHCSPHNVRIPPVNSFGPSPFISRAESIAMHQTADVMMIYKKGPEPVSKKRTRWRDEEWWDLCGDGDGQNESNCPIPCDVSKSKCSPATVF